MKLKRITSDNINQLIKNNNNLLIVFSNPDCGYCELAKNNLAEIIDDFSKLKVVECILNNNSELKEKYKISSVPIFKLIKDAKVVYTGFGVREANDLYYQLKAYLD